MIGTGSRDDAIISSTVVSGKITRRGSSSEVDYEIFDQRAKSRIKVTTRVWRRREREEVMRSKRSKIVAKNNSF